MADIYTKLNFGVESDSGCLSGLTTLQNEGHRIENPYLGEFHHLNYFVLNQSRPTLKVVLKVYFRQISIGVSFVKTMVTKLVSLRARTHKHDPEVDLNLEGLVFYF